MSALIFHPVSLVWLGLVVATAASWWMGTGDMASSDPRYMTFIVIGVALVKTRFVIYHFMEVRHAPAVLRRLADAWVVGVLVAIMLLYSNSL